MYVLGFYSLRIGSPFFVHFVDKFLNYFQAASNAEYVIEAQNLEDRRDWVATLKYCMRESRAIVDGSDRYVPSAEILISKFASSIFNGEDVRN